jgi:hypothetical protein
MDRLSSNLARLIVLCGRSDYWQAKTVLGSRRLTLKLVPLSIFPNSFHQRADLDIRGSGKRLRSGRCSVQLQNVGHDVQLRFFAERATEPAHHFPAEILCRSCTPPFKEFRSCKLRHTATVVSNRSLEVVRKRTQLWCLRFIPKPAGEGPGVAIRTGAESIVCKFPLPGCRLLCGVDAGTFRRLLGRYRKSRGENDHRYEWSKHHNRLYSRQRGAASSWNCLVYAKSMQNRRLLVLTAGLSVASNRQGSKKRSVSRRIRT